MGWPERIKPAAYTGADGVRIPFMYEDVRKVIPTKRHAWDFPAANVTYVQNNGIRSRRYPCNIFITGDNHDVDANRFENLLVQGVGRLEHPMYGPKQVIVVGDIARVDALKTAANQTVFSVEFYETIGQIYPEDSEDTGASVDVGIASPAFELQFGNSIDIGTPSEEANFLATMKALLAGMKAGLDKAQDGTAKLQNGMDAANTAMSNALTNGIGTPLTLAAQLKQIALAPGRSLALLKDKLAAYKNLASSIFGGKGTGTGGGTGSSEGGTGVIQAGIVTPGVDSTAANTFHTNNLIATYMVLGTASAVSVPPPGQAYKNRAETIASAEALQDLADEQAVWAGANFTALGLAADVVDPSEPIASGQGAVDTGESAQALRVVIGATVRLLIQTAITLPPERVHVVDRPRTPLDLCAELYGSTALLEDFIAANDFTGDEILLIPIGRRVVHYAPVG